MKSITRSKSGQGLGCTHPTKAPDPAFRSLRARLPPAPSIPATIAPMFRLGKPETPGQWIAHILLAIVALFLVWWMFRVFVL